ncbi:MAG: hypothetical protein PHP47_02565, partial [Candidatus Pacebacteria bacterium]|nr:hypothetical protein [Candidatus Paceibacterota bacterium]
MENKLLKKRKSSLKRKIGMIFFLSSFFLSFKLSVLARQLEVAYPGGPSTTAVPLETYIVYIAELIIKGGIILAGLIIAISGVQYLLSFGSVEKIINARNRIFGAFFGVLILISSFLLLRIADPNLVLLEVPSIDPIPPVIVEYPEIDYEQIDPPPDPYKGAITTEVPIGVLIKNIFEFNQFEGGEGEEPYEEPRRMDRIRNIAINLTQTTNDLVSGNETIIKTLRGCSCQELSPKSTGINNHPCPKVITWTTGAGAVNQFLEVKRNYNEGVKELNALKEDIRKLEEAEKYMRENSNLNPVSLSEYLYLQDNYKDWELSYSPLIEKIKDKDVGEYKSFASLYYLTSENKEGEFDKITNKNPSIYNWCEEIPMGDMIDLAKTLGNKTAERLETLLKISFIVMSHTTSLRDFAMSYNDNICNTSKIPGVRTDPLLMELVNKFPGLLKGPYDSVLLNSISDMMSVSLDGTTKLTEACSNIYERDLFYLFNWEYLLSAVPSWWSPPTINRPLEWFPNNFSYFLTNYWDYSKDQYYYYRNISSYYSYYTGYFHHYYPWGNYAPYYYYSNFFTLPKNFFPFYQTYLSAKHYAPFTFFYRNFAGYFYDPYYFYAYSPYHDLYYSYYYYIYYYDYYYYNYYYNFIRNEFSQYYYSNPPLYPLLNFKDWFLYNLRGNNPLSIYFVPDVNYSNTFFTISGSRYFSYRPAIGSMRFAEFMGETDKFKIKMCQRLKDSIDFYYQLYEIPSIVFDRCYPVGDPRRFPKKIYDDFCGSVDFSPFTSPLPIEEDYFSELEKPSANKLPIAHTLGAFPTTSDILTRVIIEGRVVVYYRSWYRRTPAPEFGGPESGTETIYYYNPVSTIGIKWYESADCSGDENDLSASGEEIRKMFYITYPNLSWYRARSSTYAFELKRKEGEGDEEEGELSYGTTYSYKAYAENSVGTGYGNCISFTTPPVPPLLGTVSAPDHYILEEGMKEVALFGSEQYVGLPFDPQKKPT